jgi:hypothetical protein
VWQKQPPIALPRRANQGAASGDTVTDQRAPLISGFCFFRNSQK